MKLETSRIILFVNDVNKVAHFYQQQLGLEPKTCADDPKAWQEFHAGAVTIALHQAEAPKPRRIATKIVFHSTDVPSTKRWLEARGVKMGRVVKTGDFEFCNGSDPEGNPFGISSRM